VSSASTLTAVRQQGVTQQKDPAERRLQKTTSRKTPVDITELRVRKGVVGSNKPFRDEDNDWLKGLSFTFANTTSKEIAYVEASVILYFETNNVPFQDDLTWGSMDGNGGRLKPGTSATMSMTDEQFSTLQMILIANHYPPRFNHVVVRIQGVLFSDGLFWRNGRNYYRDPLNPDKWIRDIEFMKGGKYENVKPMGLFKNRATKGRFSPSNYGPWPSATEQDSFRPASAIASEKGSFFKVGFASAIVPLQTQNCGPTQGSACQRSGHCYEARPLENVPCAVASGPNCYAEDWDVDDIGGGGYNGGTFNLEYRKVKCYVGANINNSVCQIEGPCNCQIIDETGCETTAEGCQNNNWFWNYSNNSCHEEQQGCPLNCDPYYPLDSGSCLSAVDYCGFQWGCEYGFTDGGSGCCCGATPILVDIRSGINLTDAYNGVSFDMGADGHREPIAWTRASSATAWLALDRDGDGQINSGRELFGNFTEQPNATTQRNGFVALAEFDRHENGGDNDGIIDSRDSAFAKLQLWQDANHDGISGPTELHTLSAFGIVSIDLDYKLSKRQDRYGNQFRYRSRIRFANGAERFAWDVLLQVNPPPRT
jgi:hypothetical protein